MANERIGSCLGAVLPIAWCSGGQLMPGPGAEEEGPRWLGGCGDWEPVLPALCKATRKAVRSPIARQVLLCQALARAGDTVHVPGWGVAEHSQALGMGES